MKTILYFLAGNAPTSAETAAIATLNQVAGAPYTVRVVNGKPEKSLTGITISAVAADNSYNDTGGSITAATLSASSTDNSINDSGNGLLSAGFLAGDVVTVSGFTGSTANNATGRTITSVTAAKMVLEGGTALVTDSAGESVTITSPARFLVRRFAVGDHVDVSGFTGNTANNINDAVVTAVTAAKMTIGGTDGDAIVNDAAGETVKIQTANTATFQGVKLVADYAAGTIPNSYLNGSTAYYTAFDITAPPRPETLIATQAVVTTAQEVAITSGTGTTKVTLTIAAGVITACVLS